MQYLIGDHCQLKGKNSWCSGVILSLVHKQKGPPIRNLNCLDTYPFNNL